MTGAGIMITFIYKDWPEIRKSEISLSEFCPISGDYGGLGISSLARMSLIKKSPLRLGLRRQSYLLNAFLFQQQLLIKRLSKRKKMMQNWTRPEKFDICLCVSYDCYYQKLILERRIGTSICPHLILIFWDQSYWD